MNQEQFRTITDGQLRLSQAVLEAKGHEYAVDSDVFANFKTAAHLQKITVREALAGMMAKHTVVIYDMINATEQFEVDLWTEKITDHINYLLLLKALVIHESPQDEVQAPQLPFSPASDEDYAPEKYDASTPIFAETHYHNDAVDYDKI